MRTVSSGVIINVVQFSMTCGLTVSAGLINIRKAFSPSFQISEVVRDQNGDIEGLAYRSGFKEYLASDKHLVPFQEGAENQDFPIQARSELVETYGYIFKLPREDDAKIDEHMLSQGYHRIDQFAYIDHTPKGEDGMPVAVTDKEKKQYLEKFNVVLFLDLRHTRDGGMNIYANAVEEVLWNNGLKEMKAAGAPELFLDKVRRKLKGDRVEIEHIFTEHDSRLENRLYREIMTKNAEEERLLTARNNAQIADRAMDLRDVRFEYQREALAEEMMHRYRTNPKNPELKEQRKNQTAKDGLAKESRHRVSRNKNSQDSTLQSQLKRTTRSSQTIDLTAEEKNESPTEETRRRSLRNKTSQASTSQTPSKHATRNNKMNEKALAFEGQRKNTASNKRGREAEQSVVEPPPRKKIKINIPNPNFGGQASSAAGSGPKTKYSLRNAKSIDE